MTTLRHRLARWHRAWAYARGRLSECQAQMMVLEIEAALGWHALGTLCADDAISAALERWEDSPEMRDLVGAVCNEVAHEYSGVNYGVIEYALAKVEECAAERGIVLVPIAKKTNDTVDED